MVRGGRGGWVEGEVGGWRERWVCGGRGGRVEGEVGVWRERWVEGIPAETLFACDRLHPRRRQPSEREEWDGAL